MDKMHVLNVAEKPSVAKEISHILSGGRCSRRAGLSPYNALFDFPYQIQNQSVLMTFTSVTGHLMELDFVPEYRGWHSCEPIKLFEAPVAKKIRSDDTQKKIERTLQQEARKSQWLILWLDCDREGENIAYEVKAVCERSSRRLRVFRARFSALIPRDITHAVQHLGTPDENMSLACDARSEIDLRIGAAFTRFQTIRIRNTFPDACKDKSVISYGPCQFPTLGFVVERYLQIQKFQKERFYYLSVTHEPSEANESIKTVFKWKRERVYDHTACLCLYEACLEAPEAIVTAVDKRSTWKRKPLPLTTVELQKRASRWLRLSSEITMKAAESLYNKGLISYPRTETNCFKEGTDLKGLLSSYVNHDKWADYVGSSLVNGNGFEPPRKGNGDDQAHPPIHPTKSVSLDSINDPNEKKVYEFVAIHFFACCSKDARGNQTMVRMQLQQEEFSATGLMILERNFLDIYKYEKWSSSSIPVYEVGNVFMPTTFKMEAGETCPPPLLSEADLIAKMDSNGIGTDATIAEHIKTILKREYVVKVNNDTQFKPTTLGLALVETYESMGFDLAKPYLRSAMEADCKAIALGRKERRHVVESCMTQMQHIFQNVVQCANTLDVTFSKYFSRGLSTPRTVNLPQSGSSALELEGEASSRDVPLCPAHNMPCARLQVRKEGPNKGKYFFCCSQPNKCEFFEWAEEPATVNPSGAGAPMVCSHGEPCVERLVRKEGPNKGRSFYACRRQQESSCGFFEWKDESSPGEVMPRTTARNDQENEKATVPNCKGHNVPCATRTCRKPGPNQNRVFFVCSLPQAEGCGFFVWKDEFNGEVATELGQNDRLAASNGTADVRLCECGVPAKELVCRNTTNKGRKFFKCGKQLQDDQCNFFEWG